MNTRVKEHQSIRIFKSNILEACTHVHPIVPLLVWGPFSLALMYYALNVTALSISEFALCGFLGLFFWTLTEYLVHRYVFHLPAKGFVGKSFVYLFHGLHHDDPQDPTRLVMPPVPAVILMYILYVFFNLFIPDRYIGTYMAFFTVGYLCYDYIHYATHHLPMNNKVGKYLKRYHLKHHFAHEKSKYGVSTPLWDYILGTVEGEKSDYVYEKPF